MKAGDFGEKRECGTEVKWAPHLVSYLTEHSAFFTPGLCPPCPSLCRCVCVCGGEHKNRTNKAEVEGQILDDARQSLLLPK